MKICKKCGEEKSIENFYKHNTNADGYSSNCKECINITYKEKYSKQRKKKKYKPEKLNALIQVDDFVPVEILSGKTIKYVVFDDEDDVDIDLLLGRCIGFYQEDTNPEDTYFEYRSINDGFNHILVIRK